MAIAALLAIGFVAVAYLIYLDKSPFGFADFFAALIIYGFFMYFAWKGYLWGIVGLGVFYTYDKAVSVLLLSSGGFPFGSIIFWLLGIGPLWVAFRVELAYRRKKGLVVTN